MKNINWNEVPDPVELPRLGPGGYICKITMVKDVPEKEYLYLEYDIAEGDHKGYWNELYKNKFFWGGRFYRSYKEKALSMFKGFLNAVKESNSGFVFQNDESRLVDKYVGLVLAEEEYRKNDGSDGVRLYVATVRSVDAIRKGEFKVPPKKLLSEGGKMQNTSGFFPTNDVEDDDVPF